MRRICLSLLSFVAPALGQSAGAGAAAQPQAPLTDFAGVYAYRDGQTVAIVPKNSELIAILDGALYKLRRVGGDEFRNGVGQQVTFVRNERGEVLGVKEVADFFPRQTRAVPPDVAALLVPRDARTPYRYQVPVRLGDGLEVGPAADAGLSVATLERLVHSIVSEKYPNVHGVLLWRGGRLVLEEYFYGYNRDREHQMRSATKSFFSALVGIAIDLGKIRDDKQPIAELARYCSGGVHLSGRMIETATGEDLLTFARTKLLDPLGFQGYRWPYQSVAANAGTFGQIYLRPRDMLKFGLLYLNGGRWQGRQLISPGWIERSVAPLTQIGSKPYGYFWWHQRFPVITVSSTQTVDTILATGNGGQKIFIVPSLQLIAVFTGGNYNSDKDTPPNEIMGNVILPELLQQRAKEVGAALKSARPPRP